MYEKYGKETPDTKDLQAALGTTPIPPPRTHEEAINPCTTHTHDTTQVWTDWRA